MRQERCALEVLNQLAGALAETHSESRQLFTGRLAPAYRGQNLSTQLEGAREHKA